MKANIKIDFETWFIANHLTKEGTNYYFMLGARKVYVFFEGQTATTTDTFINIRIVPYDTQRVATNTKYHTGAYKFYVYGINALLPDQIIDALSAKLDEIIIEVTGGFRIETGLINTRQRGNKFAESTHYENIAELEFYHWSA